ncbi:MAG: ABC transporter ATP-binding protein [Sedimentisphaerales bacterium]|nr:ABC transporter ATP-binding protein [Sedimentisphaerales bacterium]
MSHDGPLLSIRDLQVSFATEDGVFAAVDGVSYDVPAARTLALVGESGCGKSVTALSILRLIADPPGRIRRGSIRFRGTDLLQLSEKQMCRIRGNEIAMIFQEPMTSLNPVYTVGDQIVEAIELHQRMTAPEALDRAVEMLRLVGIADPRRRAGDYPHQLSGGMRQRVMIAMALSCNPALLIADEPTTALDVTIQAQILELLRDMQRRNRMSILLITHDLAVVAENADQVVVMYASKIVETAAVAELFAAALHPYTQGLLRSLCRLDRRRQRLDVIPGAVPDPLHFPAGCKFHPRCPLGRSDARCQDSEPQLRQVAPGHWVACWQACGHEQSVDRK